MEKQLPKIRVSISKRCQLKCSFCGGDGNKMENFQPDEMYEWNPIPIEHLKIILTEYIKQGGRSVQFTGGEPLMRKDIFDIIKMVKSIGGVPEINTNGLALNERNAKKLKESGVGVVKVSVPSFDSKIYSDLTFYDGLERVLKNVEVAQKYVPVRLNLVATKDAMDTLDQALIYCSKHNIEQLLLLELLHYPHVETDSVFFNDQYVDILKEYNEYFKKNIGSGFKKFYVDNKYESSLYVADGTYDNKKIKIFAKVSDPVHRLRECYSCDDFCQEGVYELRLSTGGYLNFCNVVNNFGYDLSNIDNLKDISIVFADIQNTLEKSFKESGKEFFEKYKLDLA